MSSSDEPLIVHKNFQISSRQSKIFWILFFTSALMVGAMLALFLAILTWNKEVADYVVINAKVWTGEDSRTWAEAIAVKGRHFAAVGTSDEIKKQFVGPQTKMIDGKNRYLVVPGFVDSHIHLLDGGYDLTSVQLRNAKTIETFISAIGEYAKGLASGVWIRGGNWNHENWGGILPTREWIDNVTMRNPVWVCRLDGHMCLANSLAMRLANISSATRDPPGGEIVRDTQGNPTGIFKDNAQALIEAVIPDRSDSEKDAALQAAMSYVLRHGVTQVHHMGSWDDLRVFERAKRSGKLAIRIYAAVPLATWKTLADFIARNRANNHSEWGLDGRGDEWLRIGNLKGFVDGSLGSHTALMFEPYNDTRNYTGLLVTSESDLYNWTLNADRNDLQVSVHAIGDRAVNLILNVFERVINVSGRPNKDRRFRVEHAQSVIPSDQPRFHQNNIIASVQPYHILDDGQWAEKIIGNRIQYTYPFANFLNYSTILAFGSDWFVAPPIPLRGIYAAVTRSTLDGKNPNGWVPSQKIDAFQSLKAYTTHANFAAFQETVKGKIKVGFLADFVIIDKDFTSFADYHAIWNCTVLYTFVDGKMSFASNLVNE
jgi:predicted amidohydrolase YtcJ